MTLPTKRFIALLLTVGLLLLIPLAAMTVTDAVNWTPADFIAAGVLLLGTGLAAERVTRKVAKPGHRIVIGGVLLVALLLIWAELAVGLFGTPFGGQ